MELLWYVSADEGLGRYSFILLFADACKLEALLVLSELFAWDF